MCSKDSVNEWPVLNLAAAVHVDFVSIARWASVQLPQLSRIVGFGDCVAVAAEKRSSSGYSNELLELLITAALLKHV